MSNQKVIANGTEYQLVKESTHAYDSFLVVDKKTGAIIEAFESVDALLDVALPFEKQRGILN